MASKAPVTAIELSEVENFLSRAKLGPVIGLMFAAVRDPVVTRLVSELNLTMFPSYFYQIWEIAGDKMNNNTPLTKKEGAELRRFEQAVRERGGTARCEAIDNRDKTIDQWLWSMCRSVRDTLEVQDAVQAAT